MEQILDLRLPACLEALSDLATKVDAFLADRPVEAYKVNLCLDELLTNTISHGFRDEPGNEVVLRLVRDEKGVEVFIEDDAPPFDPFAEAPLPDLDADVETRALGGLGVHFVRSLMDAFRYRREAGRNRIWLHKVFDDTASGPSDIK
ncbi:MAG TPA: ATP-binding protein [Azoarcus taiwanensis]|nr:ATP-binding protein [Azoarcus taiwanensis]